jgi:glutaredoxin
MSLALPARADTAALIPGVALSIAVSVVGAGGCRRAAPEAAPPPRAAPGQLEVLKEGRFLFTYVEKSGAFATTDKPDIIPAEAQQVVRVIDPGQTKNTEIAMVYVVDVRSLLKDGKAAARPLSREAFETAALAQLPPGASSPLAARRAAEAHQQPPPGPVDAAAVVSPPGTPVVTIYGTSWCGACRAARQYFAERKIPFADRDVERDPAAARELAEKASKLGIPTDRVPIIDVRGRLLQGFDRARIETLLGEAT